MTQEEQKAVENYASKISQEPPCSVQSNMMQIENRGYLHGLYNGVICGAKFLSNLRKPSEDIKQTIEDAAAKYAGISDDKFANSAKTYDAYNIDESFKNGAEFALRLSENSGQVDEDLKSKVRNIFENVFNRHCIERKDCDGFPIGSICTNDVAFYDMEQELCNEITALIPSSPSGENGAELLEAAKQILDLHVCEMEGLSSGQPTPTEWMNAVDKLSEAISNYEKQSK